MPQREIFINLLNWICLAELHHALQFLNETKQIYKFSISYIFLINSLAWVKNNLVILLECINKIYLQNQLCDLPLISWDMFSCETHLQNRFPEPVWYETSTYCETYTLRLEVIISITLWCPIFHVWGSWIQQTPFVWSAIFFCQIYQCKNKTKIYFFDHINRNKIFKAQIAYMQNMQDSVFSLSHHPPSFPLKHNKLKPHTYNI